ncbi:TetR/AcrR family transcriptional regulator [Streptomyces endophyticus]|uniref:TetR/AcrR family transcriptional regulator n=1 Tax=Streptomyces endophyticus TaxID=714166 RepID=A0ABU6FDA3_9ACTN|nr:helix-turn-helix domain-containing protein [Streptomyces endophyticus]MEB8340816.1 TetR/AcrR family transcriptional regulator [Streptomyces endophyticus]
MPAEQVARGGARSLETRHAIMAAAERLYAEQGIAGVSNRQISEAAGQGNVAAVGYHFGSKVDLVRAITAHHSAAAELIRQDMLDRIADPEDVRAWVECLVRPVPEYLAGLDSPSWYARFSSQLMTDPVLRAVLTDDALNRRPLAAVLRGLGPLLGHVPAEVRRARAQMATHLIGHTCAEHEERVARGEAPPASWRATATLLTDAVSGMFAAPSTPTPKECPA